MASPLVILRYACTRFGTFGIAIHDGEWLCHTLEPADLSGRKACGIAEGSYSLIFEYSPKFRTKLPTIVVHGRSGLRIHAGNVVGETTGCLLVGLARSGQAIERSRPALANLCVYINKHNITSIHYINAFDNEKFSC